MSVHPLSLRPLPPARPAPCPAPDLHGGRARWIDLPVVHDARGDLSFAEGGRHIPFAIARVYHLYNLPAGALRGGHAHRDLQQVIFALSGRFRIRLDDGRQCSAHWLDDPARGLWLDRMLWREMDAFSAGAVCLVLASAPYDEADYIRDHGVFRAEAARAAGPARG